MKIRIIITLKKGVLDTQGKAIESSLNKNLGFPQISQVRQGKVVELEIAETDPVKIKAIVDIFSQQSTLTRFWVGVHQLILS